MQITAKFAILFAAVAYGSLSVAALPTFNQYNTRELSVDFDTRDLSYLDARDFEEFSARQDITPTPAPAPVAPVSAVEQTTHSTAGGAGPVAPPKLTHEELAAHRAALADPTHPNHQKALERKKTVTAYHKAALADPTHPHHAKATAIEDKRKAFSKQHKEALNDPTHRLHKHAQAYEAQKLHKAALADPTHPNHAAAQAKEEKRKAFRKLHQEALNDPNHHLHEKAKAHEAKKLLAKQQVQGGASASGGALPHAHENAAVSGPTPGAKQTLHRRDYY